MLDFHWNFEKERFLSSPIITLINLFKMHLLALPSFSEVQYKINDFHESSLLDSTVYLCFGEIRSFYLAFNIGCGLNAYSRNLQNIIFLLL